MIQNDIGKSLKHWKGEIIVDLDELEGMLWTGLS